MKDEGVQTHKFKYGLNVINDNLKYTLADDVKIQIVAKVILQDNTKLEWKEPQEAGDAEIRTFLIPGAKNLNDLKKSMHRTSFPPIRWIRWKVLLQPLVNRW